MLASQKFRGHPVSERLRAWQKCGHKIIVVYTVYLPSAHGQMESLLQKQLRQCRWAQGPCERHARKGGPGPCHHEWFQVSEDVARDAIDLWACFSASLPYHPSGRLKGRWRQIATEWDEILKKVESKSSVGLMDEWVNKIRGELIPPKGRKRKPRVSDKGGRVKAEPDDGFETEPDDGFESE
ncbi:hypothetical protein GQ53DRAFT_133772 [Thozetella sp. PMI_491]|nr:hypothetical protein GQ53DRAFT_133772 [Thozetella sp. PMI_491]